jgi:hypothetical protein
VTDLPHFDLPFRWNAGHLTTTEQGEVKDVQNQVRNVVATPVGFRDEYPEFGNPQYGPFGSAPLETAPLEAAIDDLVPDARATLEEHASSLSDYARTIVINIDPEQN